MVLIRNMMIVASAVNRQRQLFLQDSFRKGRKELSRKEPSIVAVASHCCLADPGSSKLLGRCFLPLPNTRADSS
jgi:hypothetical protein